MSGSRDRIWLVAFLAVCFGAATVGGWSTSRSVNTWYQTLHKPSFSPPGWVFGPVWTVLYAAMAVAAWLVRREADRTPARAAGGTRTRVGRGQLGL